MTLEPFLATYTGGKFYPFGPDPDAIKIEDVAGSLSKLCRYAGHTSDLWSVALHSLEVCRRVEALHAPPRVCLAALLHDAGEAYLLDVPRPIKPLFLNYREWSENLERAVAARFDLPYPWPVVVDNVDKAMVPIEVANFFPPGSAAWRRYGIGDQIEHDDTLTVYPYPVAEEMFLETFDRLGGRR